MKKIIISSDIDWAIDEVIDEFTSIFTEFEVPCTLFCTHTSPKIEELDSLFFEKAIHPNFNPSLIDGRDISAERIIGDLLNIFPLSKGIRSHSMTTSTQLNNLFFKNGLKYESNLFLPYHWNIKPFMSWTGLTSIPYHWEDDVHFSYENSFEADFDLIFSKSDQFIFDFHPIHVFLNTDNELTYLNAKGYYKDYLKLKKLRNRDVLGVRDYLVSLIKFAKKKGYEFLKMDQLIIR